MPSRPFVPSSPVTVSLDGGLPRLKPLAQIIALLMVAGGAQASQPFSAAWFAAKGAQQSAGAARPGAQLPGMTPPPLAQQQKVNQQLQRSLQNLNNTVAAIAAQQAAQAAGRQAALAAPTDIPDGLGEGGLKVDASLPFEQAWQNAKAPVQSQADGRTTVTVEQTADRAILNWETFNIGRQTTLQFDQQSNWAVLNRVNDPSARPSQIQGQIKADGTVMAIENSTLPARLLPDPTAVGDSLYEYLDGIGRPVVRALQHVRAINASASDAALVGIAPGTAMLLMTRIGYLEDNTPIELTDTYCRNDYYDFVAELRR